jgi:hypothetical protein
MDRPASVLSRIWRALLRPLVAVVALVLVFEEWLWDALQRRLRRWGAWLGLQRIEGWLRGLGPWASLAVMALPAMALFPFKLAALWALGRGHVALGLVVLVSAKLVGTALAAYLFDLVRERARQLPWFDAFYSAALKGFQRAHAWLEAQPGFRAAKAWAADVKAWVRSAGGAGGARRPAWRRRLQWAKIRLQRWLKGGRQR